MYTRHADQEITPVPTALAIGLALVFAALIAVTAIAVLSGAKDSNEVQTKAVEQLRK